MVGRPIQTGDTAQTAQRVPRYNEKLCYSWEHMNWDFLAELPKDQLMQLGTFDQLSGISLD
jgi:hypothetical protein